MVADLAFQGRRFHRNGERSDGREQPLEFSLPGDSFTVVTLQFPAAAK